MTTTYTTTYDYPTSRRNRPTAFYPSVAVGRTPEDLLASIHRTTWVAADQIMLFEDGAVRLDGKYVDGFWVQHPWGCEFYMGVTCWECRAPAGGTCFC